MKYNIHTIDAEGKDNSECVNYDALLPRLLELGNDESILSVAIENAFRPMHVRWSLGKVVLRDNRGA